MVRKWRRLLLREKVFSLGKWQTKNSNNERISKFARKQRNKLGTKS
jgi:hypothetical protein